MCIAAEPVVARFIQKADLNDGSWWVADGALRANKQKAKLWFRDVEQLGNLARLLAQSSYLREAGLDWRHYYHTIRKEVSTARYSQHAAAFLLTLLTNIKNFKLPDTWMSLEATDKLINVIVYGANHSHHTYDGSSLGRLTGISTPHDLMAVEPFLSMPKVQSFVTAGQLALDDDHQYTPVEPRLRNSGGGLEDIDLQICYVEPGIIARFLAHTPNLTTFHYEHTNDPFMTYDDPFEPWDMCKFVENIAQAVGGHLRELSITIVTPKAEYILPGTVSMRGFERLRTLTLPLEIVHCNVLAALNRLGSNYRGLCRDPGLDSLYANDNEEEDGCTKPSTTSDLLNHVMWKDDSCLISNYVPASVTLLALAAPGRDSSFYTKILEALFRDFGRVEGAQ